MSFFPTFPGAYTMSAVSASATGSAIDLRGSNGNFMMICSAGQNGPSGGASATFWLEHNPFYDPVTGWTQLGALFTASSTGVANPFLTASFSAGAYGFVRARLSAVFSAAQTGTANVAIFILPGQS